MAEQDDILKDPNFHALPLEERRKVMLTIDPSFGALPTSEQDKVFKIAAIPDYAARQPKPEPDPGFFSTLGNAAMNAPKNLMDFMTGHPMNEMDKDFAQKARISGDAFRSGDIPTGVGMGLAAFLPGSGDEAIAAGNEFGQGHWGAGSAHTALALAPFMREPAAAVASRVSNISLPSIPPRFTTPQAKAAMIDFLPVYGSKINKLRKALEPSGLPESPGPRMNWPPSAELPRSQPPKPGAPPPSAELPRTSQPSPPAGRPNWPPSAELPRLPTDPEEVAIQDQIAKQKAGTLTPAPALTPLPGEVTPAIQSPFSIKPGEGTHLDMSHVKAGEVPVKADYQTGARNLWAANMERELAGMSSADVEKMSLEDMTARAKKAALGGPSPEKIRILIERLRLNGK